MMEYVNVLMIITGKRRYIHRARRSDDYSSDEDDKQFLINLLWSEFKIACIRGEPFLGYDGKRVYPDCKTTNYNPETYFEMDGEYHGFGDITKTKKTKGRDDRYIKSGKNLIVINKAGTNDYERKQIIKLLQSYGMKKKEL